MRWLNEAQLYCGHFGVEEAVGSTQLEMLQNEGLQPNSKVLEIGCGCLTAGLKIMSFLEPGGYIGIEPNDWLIKARLYDDENARRLVEEKKPVFLQVKDFDASAYGPFDLILSHSILTHCGPELVDLFFRNVYKSLTTDGKALVSIDFGDENTNRPGWTYPDAVFYREETIMSFALQNNLTMMRMGNYRQLLMSRAEKHTHDWVVLRPA